MPDYGTKATEDALRATERRVRSVYTEAQHDVQAKMDDFVKRHRTKDREYQMQLTEGKITQKQYEDWMRGQVFQGQMWESKLNGITNTLANSNSRALAIVNGQTRGVFAENANWTSYQMEHGAGIDFGFGLYDESTVNRLIRDNPKLLPNKKLNVPKDKAWNQDNITRQITQGIIQGEKLEDVAKRLQKVTDMNKNSALTNARTAMTGAQNAGRVESINRANRIGIKTRKEWLATLDGHTRSAHTKLDGQKVDHNKPFKVDGYTIMYPGDPQAHPSLVYGCRCTLIADLIDYPSENAKRYDNITGKPIEDLTYKEWKNSKFINNMYNQPSGTDLIGTWQRRPDMFDFEIEDAMNAQGFDGLPRVVSAQEFDEAVKESGFIAQRTYSAPNEEVLEAYRDQLYNGKWYVDCSTGGAQYGQGMYCAADYTGTLTRGIGEEMRHYQELNTRRGNPFSYTETLTLDKSAKIVTYDTINGDFIKYKQSAKRVSIEKQIRNLDGVSDDLLTSVKGEFGVDDVSFSDAFKAYGRLSESEIEKRNEIVSIIRTTSTKAELDAYGMNVGSYAVLKGYDAINATGHGASGSYTVILNRTKCIIKKG